jgi:hypothetical protein
VAIFARAKDESRIFRRSTVEFARNFPGMSGD